MKPHTRCLIAGGGPAEIMLGLLLARGGVDVTVLEKHADFLRDFRGDTVHASTIRLLDEMGLLEAFSKLPQSRLKGLQLPTGNGQLLDFGDFSRLKAPYNYIAMIPQWDFLDFLADAARNEPTFHLEMNIAVKDLVWDGDRVTGVTYVSPDGEGQISADLVIACDGRHSSLRDAASLVPISYDVPFDVWWFRLPRHPAEQAETASLIPSFAGSDIMLSIARDTFFQCAAFIPKGTDTERRAKGIGPLRDMIARLRPDFADRVGALHSMDDVKTLDVKLNRLPQWHRPGLLCIGDAAHAMSPAGGVGINLAIQDAVATARILRDPLLDNAVTPDILDAVRQRREMPTRLIQRLQRTLHKVIFEKAFETGKSGPPSLIVFLTRHFPAFRRIPAWLIAIGPRSEHAPDFARRPLS